MALNLDVVGRSFDDPTPWRWTDKDTLLYALSVGAGRSDPQLSTENTRGVAQQVVPTFAVLMGTGGVVIPMSTFGDFSMQRVLHAGQRVVLHGPIAPAGSALCRQAVTGIYDKGRNALLELSASFTDPETGEPIAESITQIMVRGEGGWGGDPGPSDAWERPDREPDHVVSAATSPDQALLYRLNGDRNPLHSDPAFAKEAGLPTPILHGLCTYGFAARAVLETASGGDTGRFGSIGGRFSSPVLPGDVLTTRVWREDGGALFQTTVDDRVVLDRGTFSLR